MTEETTVKCQDCGLLAVVDAEKKHRECPQEWRDDGDRPTWLAREGCSHSPACHVGEFKLADEYKVAVPPHDPDTKARTEKGRKYLHVITMPRVCPKHVPYRVQLTPEQHIEQAERAARRSADATWEREKMDIHREIELMRMNWQAEQAIKQRHWQEDFAAKQAEEKRNDDRVQREWQAGEAEKQRKHDRKWRIIAGIGGAVCTIVGFFGGIYFAPTNSPPVEPRAIQLTDQVQFNPKTTTPSTK